MVAALKTELHEAGPVWLSIVQPLSPVAVSLCRQRRTLILQCPGLYNACQWLFQCAPYCSRTSLTEDSLLKKARPSKLYWECSNNPFSSLILASSSADGLFRLVVMLSSVTGCVHDVDQLISCPPCARGFTTRPTWVPCRLVAASSISTMPLWPLVFAHQLAVYP